jgi:hypothetical protein
MDSRVAHRAEVAVHAPNRSFELVSQPLVLLDLSAAWGGNLNKDGFGRMKLAFLEKFAIGTQPVKDPLGVIQPVDPEKKALRVSNFLPDLACALDDVGPLCERRELLGVYRYWERGGARGADAYLAAGFDLDKRALGVVVRQAPACPQEVVGTVSGLEPDQVGAKQALYDFLAPRQLREQLVRRERDVVEKADPQVRPKLTQHRRAEL